MFVFHWKGVWGCLKCLLRDRFICSVFLGEFYGITRLGFVILRLVCMVCVPYHPRVSCSVFQTNGRLSPDHSRIRKEEGGGGGGGDKMQLTNLKLGSSPIVNINKPSVFSRIKQQNYQISFIVVC